LTLTTGPSGAAVGTATIASNVFTITGHGLVDGQVVMLSSLSGGAIAALVEGAPYYVAAAATDTFQLRPAPGAPVMVVASGGAIVDIAEAVQDAQGWRQAQSGLMYKGRPTSPNVGRFGARSGILRNGSLPETSVSGLTVTVEDTNAFLCTAGSTVRGGYLVAVPTTTHTLATADPSQTRVDRLVLEVLDDAADGSNEVIPGRTRIIQGTPGLGAPATPDGTISMATYTLTAGSGTATEVRSEIYTVAIGGILPVATVADLPAGDRRTGDYATVAENGTLYHYNGSAWQPVASTSSFAATQRRNTTTRTSNTATFTAETLVDSVTANLVAGATYRITWAFSAVSTVAGDLVRVRLREDNLTGTIRELGGVYISHSGQKILGRIEGEYTAVATGSKTFVGTSMRFAGTGNISHNASTNEPHFLYVDYIRG
jgi:hypothetical protein